MTFQYNRHSRIGQDRPHSAFWDASSDVTDTSNLQISIVTDIQVIEQAWRRLEQRAPSTIYQKFDFCAAWLSTLGVSSGAHASVITGWVGEELVLLLPLCTRKFAGLRETQFIGGSHANYNLPLIDPALATSWTAADMDGLLANVRRNGLGSDLLCLSHMPLTWRGRPNLMAEGGKVDDVAAYSGRLDASYDELLRSKRSKSNRSKSRRKLSKLLESGTVVFSRVDNEADMVAAAREFVRQKSERSRDQHIPSAFDDPAAGKFLVDLAVRSAGAGDPILELYVLTIDGQIHAVFGGGAHQGRFSGCFTSFRDSELARYAPGEHLLNFVVQNCCDRQLREFDLGVGDSAYKKNWCETREPMAHRHIAQSLKGQLALAMLQPLGRLKQWIKRSPRRMQLVNRIRLLRPSA